MQVKYRSTPRCSNRLRLPPSLWRDVARLPTTLLKATPTSFLGKTTALAPTSAESTRAASTASPACATPIKTRVAATKCVWSWSAFFDIDLLGPDFVRVCGNSSIVASWCSKFNERAALNHTSACFRRCLMRIVLALGRETSKYFISPYFSKALLSLLASIFSVTFLM